MKNSDWQMYHPRFNGDCPLGFDSDTHEVEFLDADLGNWIANPDGQSVSWFSNLTYRIRDRRQPAFDHPLVGDDCPTSPDCQKPLTEAAPSTSGGSLPDDASKRLQYPMADGLLDYFPNALAEVAFLSHCATQQHHPDEDMHWDRSKSTDHANKIIRHLVDRGKRDDKGQRHSTMVAWRALAQLQEEIERDEGLPPSRASRNRPY